ncbi:MAG: alpha/beta hydrolase, partial [Actinomycetota bacterium]
GTMRRLVIAVLSVALLVTGLPARAADHTAENATVTNPGDGTKIAITIFKPAGAGPDAQVPVILHSHGWAGSRTSTISGAVKRFLDAGFGVVSIDQRGHGQSGGQANVQDPTKETEDIKAVIDKVASLPWVAHNLDAGGNPIANDPLLGAIGGSYGGGYQTMTALDEIADEGRTRFDALAPEITWFDLPESLAPQGVARTAWVTALYAAGARMVPQYIHEGFAWGAATGQWPDGSLLGQRNAAIPDLDSEFHKHAPAAFVEKGILIDVPVLMRQGSSDNLFNLNQGIKIFEEAVTDEARSQSYFVAYNGGHALPNALPPGTAAGSDACSPNGDFTELTIDFYKRIFSGTGTDGLLPDRYNLTTAAGDSCLRLDDLDARRKVDVDPLGTGSTITTAGAGAPINIAVAEGPLTRAGIPTLEGRVTTATPDARAFFGLSVGKTPADARVIQNNLMPLRRVLPVSGDDFRIELPGIAAQIAEGETLFLTITPVSDMSFGHGSRVAGPVVLEGLQLSLPTDKGCPNPKGKGKAHGPKDCRR